MADQLAGIVCIMIATRCRRAWLLTVVLARKTEQSAVSCMISYTDASSCPHDRLLSIAFACWSASWGAPHRKRVESSIPQ